MPGRDEGLAPATVLRHVEGAGCSGGGRAGPPVEELGEAGLELEFVGEQAVELGERCLLGDASQGA